MATLQKIRNRGGVLVVIIGVALVAFILGDFLNSGQAFFGSGQMEIAEISGKSVSYQDFARKVDEVMEVNKSMSGQSALDEATSERIREQVWQQINTELIMSEEYEDLGLAISEDELYDLVQGNNIAPIVQQLFANPETGQVDKAQVRAFLKNMDVNPQQKALWLYFENMIVEQRLMAKYNNLVKKGLYVPQALAQNEYTENARKVDMRYVSKKYSSIPDSTISVSDSEIKSYYNDHKDNYQQEATRGIEYVAFVVRPSADDDKMAEKWINEIKPEFEQTKEDIQFVNMNADTRYIDRNYTKEDLPAQIKDFMYEAKEGDVYGPYKDNETYKLAKLHKIVNVPDSVRARHILISPNQELDIVAAKAKADSLKGLIDNGANFANLAMLHSDDKGSAKEGGVYEWFPEGQMVKPFNDACFQGKVGDVQVVQTQFGYHIIEVLAQSKKAKKVQVAIVDRQVVPSQRTFNTAFNKANRFAGENRDLASFTKSASEQGLAKRVAPYIRANDKRISGLENPRQIVRWAFEANQNDVSEVFELGDRYVVAVLKTVKEKGNTPVNDVAAEIRIQIRKDKKAEKIMADIKAMKATNIDELASKLGSTIEKADNISFTSFSVPGAGIEPNLIATAAILKEGKLSQPIKGNNAVFVTIVDKAEKEEVNNFDPERVKLTSSLQSRASYEVYNALQKAANVVDNRAKFY